MEKGGKRLSAVTDSILDSTKAALVIYKDYKDFDEATKDSSLILILTDHNQFKDLDYETINKNMKTKIIFDTKNIIKDVPEDVTLINYGNLYKFIH